MQIPKPAPRRIATLILVVLAAAGGFLYAKKGQLPIIGATTQQAVVDYAIDGDTIKLPSGERVRLIGIDSPEKGQCFYDESRAFAQELLDGKAVILERDISGKDDYDRLLRYVFLPAASQEEDRVLVNDALVRSGHAQAVASPPDSRYRDLLISAQEEAIRKNLGMWASCEYEDELAERRESNDEPPTTEHIIKGNISTRGYGKTYLIPGCDNYNLVKIDLEKGEQ
ncbi:MAG: thermonuclease family protein, partial [Patescibacteria group bacterium]|nr:thermonuclease family protein [Patescibacteria group bacterium]